MKESFYQAFLGSLVADAAAMPVHWYYNVQSLDCDYPELAVYTAPKNPHPDSILWRSSYKPRNSKADILHDQASYWGKRGVHYHQFLEAGENTLNYRLAVELYNSILQNRSYHPTRWLQTYVELMRRPGWHKDTYVEEYHRAFFDRLASGITPEKCGIDDLHIGALATVPALLAGLSQVEALDYDRWIQTVLQHVALTHRNAHALKAAEALALILMDLAHDEELDSVLKKRVSPLNSPEQFKGWSDFEDRTIVGRHLTPACYLPDSFSASLFLAWKYRDDFKAGILANARCGGDNCHRGAVVGSILGSINNIPKDWLKDLKSIGRVTKQEKPSSV
ncbi:MAG: ADP-ribosylglycohydrolase family protein [Verrucomicrobia bacterium]|nr:ADP-ribosylglycohydrolase family protein [Verrucomicrobiota bacterium]MDA1065630.1 ADP-ribosylglycohydrolase family protein [Verrucomicrobiota bacterium]